MLLLLTLLTYCPQTAHAGETTLPEKQDRTVLCDRKERPQAVLSDASRLVRICASRPQRVVPSCHQTLGSSRTTGGGRHLFYFQKISFSHHRGDGTPLSAPVMDAPQTDYYVVTLRRLLC